MQSVILVIHLIVALAIIAIVLVQPSETGGFLGTGGSMTNMMAPRRQGDALTRLTTILAGIFFITSLSLAIYAERAGKSSSILDVPTGDETVKTAPANAGVKADETVPAPAADALKKVVPEDKKKQAAPEKSKKKPSAPISK